MPSSEESSWNKNFTISNAISAFRIFLIIPTALFFASDDLLIVGTIMVIAYLSDLADGYVARRRGTITEMGKVLDPIADKLYVGTLLIFMVLKAMVPAWLVIVVLLKDLLTMIGALLIRKRINSIPPSNYWGKAAILCTIIFLFLSVRGVTSDVLLFGWILSAALLTISFVVYCLRAYRIVRQ